MRIKNIRKLVIGNLSIFCPSKHLTNRKEVKGKTCILVTKKK